MSEKSTKKKSEENVAETKKEKKSENVDDKLKKEADRETEKIKNAETKTKEARIQYEKIVLFTILTAVGTVLLGMGVQYFYNKLVIEPQDERTFPYFIPIQLENNIHVVFNQSSILHLVNLNESSTVASLWIKPADNETKVSRSGLDWYQLNDGDGKTFGKLQYQYNHLIVTIRYVVNDEQIVFTFDAIGYDHNRATAKHTIVISEGNDLNHEVQLFDSSQEAFVLPEDDSLSSVSYEVYNNISLESEANFRDKFDEVYKLRDKNLPVFYQEMGRVALTTVLHSLRFKNQINLHGAKNGNFELNQLYLNLLTEDQNSIDLQVYSLITASYFDPELVQNIIASWLSTINKRNEIGNAISENRLLLGRIQQPMFFQLLKAFLKNPILLPFLKLHYDQFVYLAEETMKNSVESSMGNVYYKWQGHASGLFGLQTKSGEKESSLELLCLLEDMNRVMSDLAKLLEKPTEKYDTRIDDFKNARNSYWSGKDFEFGDLIEGKWSHSSQASLVPLILGLLETDSPELEFVFASLSENESWSKAGIRKDAESGSNVAANYLFLGALKKWSEKSGPLQMKTHVMYSIEKNNMITNIVRGYRARKSLFGSYNEEWTGLNHGESNDGTLILLIMAELFI